MSDFNKTEVSRLAKLARLELNASEEERLAKDLQKILDYFSELNALDTAQVTPMTGGTFLKSVFREDESERTDDTGKGKDQFPVAKDGYLKIPNIFEQ